MTQDEIRATHETQFISESSQIGEAYPVMATITKVDDTWKVLKGSYALLNDPAHELAFDVGKTLRPK